MTNAQRGVLADLSGGKWAQLIPKHTAHVITKLIRIGFIRTDCQAPNYKDRLWMITKDGKAALKAAQ